MATPLSLEEKKFIEKSMSEGKRSAWIASELGVSIWVVYKWRRLIKKGSLKMLGAALVKGPWVVSQPS